MNTANLKERFSQIYLVRMKNNNVIAKVISVVLFLLILFLLILETCKVLGPADPLNSKKVFEDYYNQNEKTVDGVYFGTSATQRGWIAPRAYKKYGLAVYSLATASQPLCVTGNLMKEAEKSQSPMLYIVDLRNVCVTPDDIADSHIRRVTDSMKMSLNRFRTVDTALDFASKGDNDVDVKDKSYYIRLIKYHNLWNKGLRPKKEKLIYLQGFAYYQRMYYRIVKKEDCGIVTGAKALDPNVHKVLESLLDYCDNIKADVLFVVSPCVATKDEVMKYNGAGAYIRGRGYTVLNFFDPYLRKAVGIDYDTFFYDDSHMNYYGAAKYSDYLSQYIMNHYHLPDRRGDRCFIKWQKASDRLDELTGNKYNEFVEYVENE